MKILAIETSCDETAIAIIETSNDMKEVTILSNVVLSQAQKHAEYGGVFPTLAKREHAKNLTPVMQQALKESGLLVANEEKVSLENLRITKSILNEREPELEESLNGFISSYAKPAIDQIVVTNGPGLEPALWVGVNFAKAISAVWNIPITPINHMEGHVLSVMVPDEAKIGEPFDLPVVQYPALSLLISGKHTELVLSSVPGEYELLGATQDDASGEAFDKVARMLGFPYPGGPHISKMAESGQINEQIKLPRPMIGSGNYNFSFSGLKTAVLYLIRDLGGLEKLSDQQKSDIALEFEQAVIDVLTKKTLKALTEHNAKTLIIGGGVSANTKLRNTFETKLKQELPDVQLMLPTRKLATDNALMIALAGIHKIGTNSNGTDFSAIGNLSITSSQE